MNRPDEKTIRRPLADQDGPLPDEVSCLSRLPSGHTVQMPWQFGMPPLKAIRPSAPGNVANAVEAQSASVVPAAPATKPAALLGRERNIVRMDTPTDRKYRQERSGTKGGKSLSRNSRGTRRGAVERLSRHLREGRLRRACRCALLAVGAVTGANPPTAAL